MATVPAQADTGTYGISVTATGITIESITITETPQTETVPDQANAVVNEITYDKRVDLKLTYRGTKLTETNGCVTVNSVKYFVDSHEEAGTYNGLKRYNLTGHKFNNFPAQS